MNYPLFQIILGMAIIQFEAFHITIKINPTGLRCEVFHYNFQS